APRPRAAPRDAPPPPPLFAGRAERPPRLSADQLALPPSRRRRVQPHIGRLALPRRILERGDRAPPVGAHRRDRGSEEAGMHDRVDPSLARQPPYVPSGGAQERPAV